MIEPKPDTLTQQSPPADVEATLAAAERWAARMDRYRETAAAKIRFYQACLGDGYEVPCGEYFCQRTFFVHPLANGRPREYCSDTCRRKAVRRRSKSERRIKARFAAHPATRDAVVEPVYREPDPETPSTAESDLTALLGADPPPDDPWPG